MAEPLSVNIDDLRTALDRALTATEALLGKDVELSVDFYWHLPVGSAFDMTREPRTFTVGQVSDDLENIHDDSARVPEQSWHDLSHLIGVLRALELTATS